jgi:hypothetical protein
MRALPPKRVCRKQIDLWPDLGAPLCALARHLGSVDGSDYGRPGTAVIAPAGRAGRHAWLADANAADAGSNRPLLMAPLRSGPGNVGTPCARRQAAQRTTLARFGAVDPLNPDAAITIEIAAAAALPRLIQGAWARSRRG